MRLISGHWGEYMHSWPAWVYLVSDTRILISMSGCHNTGFHAVPIESMLISVALSHTQYFPNSYHTHTQRMMRYSTAIIAVVLLAVARTASGAFTGSGSGDVSLSGPGLGLLSQVLISDIPDQTVTIGRNATFICNASSDDGDPILAYSWIRDGMVLSDGSTASGSQVNGSSSETLLIVGVTDGDEGNYSCCASDSIGSTNTSNTAILTVG